MSDEQDAAPTRPGQAATPKWFVTFAIMEDSSFAIDHNLPDEMMGRALIHKGSFMMDRFFSNQVALAQLQKAQENQVIAGMMGADAGSIQRKLRRLKG